MELSEIQLHIEVEDKNTCQSIDNGTLKDVLWINIELLPLEWLDTLYLIFGASVLIYLLEPVGWFVVGFISKFIWEMI